jgi:hypothetical protein
MGFDGFQNSPVGAQGIIARNVFKSENYVPGVSGWAIFKDGTAEFNTLGGSFQITGQGIFFYVPTAGSGNLIVAFTNTGGTDPYGNTFQPGLFLNQKQAWLTGDNSHTVTINANTASGPQILFTVAGNPSMAEIIGDQSGGDNRLLIQATGGSGSILEFNIPVRATGGYIGQSRQPVAQPPWNVVNTMVDFAANKWAPLTMLCPPSETVEIDINTVGFNNNSTTSTLTVAVGVKAGATVIVTPTQYLNGATITPEGAPAASTAMHQKFRRYTVGQDLLAGFAGQTLTFTPAWQISSGSAATCSIDNTASFAARPSLFSQAQSG